MKFRFFAVLTLVAGLCLASTAYGQTIRECGVVKVPVCSTGSGAEWFWLDSRLIRPVATAPSRTFAKRSLSLPPLTADAWNSSSGNWNVAGNWTAGVPTTSDAVTIGTSNGSVTVNITGAAAGTLSIVNSNTLNVSSGNSLNVAGATSVTGGGYLYVGYDSGGTMTSGSFTNSADLYVGNTTNTAAANLTITGTLTNTGGYLQVTGGSSSAGSALINISGAAPSTVTGTYYVYSNTGSAAVEFGSGSITAIGTPSTDGSVTLNGAKAYMGVGAANNNNALAGLNTINYYGSLYLYNGASLTTTSALTNDGGYLEVDNGGSGGSTLTVGGALTNTDTGDVYVGNGGMSSPATLKVATISESDATIDLTGGSTAAGKALLNVTGAAPSTLYGVFNLTSNTGSAAVEFGSGSITEIGDSTTTGSVTLNGPKAYMEIGATNNESALTSLNTIGYDSALYLYNGASLTTTGALTNNGGYLEVDNSGSGGSTLTIDGGLTNIDTGDLYVGNGSMSSPVTLKVMGALSNSGGTVQVNGGGASGANALLNVTGAAPGTLLGTYDIVSNTASAAVEFGSGSITAIGASNTLGSVTLNGPKAYLEIGATNSESALTSLNTIAYDSALYLYNGASLTATGALANNGGYLELDNGGAGGSTLTIGGALTNTDTGIVDVGSGGITSAATLKVSGALSNTDSAINVTGGQVSGANALLNVTGAAPTTLTGTYNLQGNQGFAAVEFGSGSITTIGDGSTNAGGVTLTGPNAYLEIGATNSESALTGLKTISSNGYLYLYDGASLTTTKAFTNDGILQIDHGGTGGSTFWSKASLTNTGSIYLGNSDIGSTATLKTAAAVTNSSTGLVALYGNDNSGVNTVWELTGPTLSNSGTISLMGGTASDATLEIGANITTSGKGSIQLSNATTNLITGTSSSFTLTNGSTIEGSGTISNMGIVNTGTISANQSTPLLILPSSLRLNNQGTLSVSSGDTMQIGTSAGGALTNLSGTTLTGGTYTVGGTMQFGASGASIVTDAANISLTGAGAQMINFGGNSLLTNLATITSTGSFTLGSGWGTFTTTGNFTNNGTLSVGAADKFIVDLSDSLTNLSGTTLTGGTYKITGTLEFAGANIVTNDASITLTGAGSKIDGKNGANGLANLAVNNGSFILGKGRSFTTAGNFTNNGLLTVGAGDTFDVDGNLTNFSGGTLHSGNYNVSGTLEFNNASIVTNAATITLGSATAKIENQSAANAMLGFTTNTSTGKFTLSGNASLTTTGGSFTNAGTVTVDTGSTFTIGGSSYNYTQTAGTTTVDGTLANTSNGSLSLNGGNLYGTGTLDYGVSDSATITPGNSSTSEGKLQVNGTYAQNSSGALDVTIGGTTAGTNYDQLNVSGTASLNGTLNISLGSGYTPTVGTKFDILNASSVTGSFSTVNGLAINSNEHFTVTEISGDEIELTVVSGPAPTISVSLTPSAHPGLQHGRYGLGVYRPSRLPVSAPTLAHLAAPVISGLRINRGFHAMDDFGAPVALPSASGSSGAGVPALPGISAVSALAYNPMASMNHAYFECGVSLNALRHVGGKRLLKSLWAAPDSPDALRIGYMTMTTSR